MTPDQIAAAVDGAAAAIGLPLQPEHRLGVLQYYALAARMADQVMGLPLGLADEPAPVFTPVSPGGAGAA